MLKYIFSFALFFVCALQLQAQSISKAHIRYQIFAEGEALPSTMTMLNGALVEYMFSGQKQALKGSVLGGLVSMNFRGDQENSTALLLMSMMGDNKAISLNAKDMESLSVEGKKQGFRPKFQELKGNKTVAGHSCKRLRTKLPDGQVLTLFLCEDFPSPMNNPLMAQFGDIKGLPLAAELKSEGQKIRIVAQEVAKEVKEQEFLQQSPAGYQKLSWQEWQTWMQGQGKSLVPK